jgi:hypothetical protein
VHHEKKRGSGLARLLPPPRLAPPVQRLVEGESRGSLRGLLLGIAAGLLFFSLFLLVFFRSARPAQ